MFLGLLSSDAAVMVVIISMVNEAIRIIPEIPGITGIEPCQLEPQAIPQKKRAAFARLRPGTFGRLVHSGLLEAELAVVVCVHSLLQAALPTHARAKSEGHHVEVWSKAESRLETKLITGNRLKQATIEEFLKVFLVVLQFVLQLLC